jgi:hypothetical protein
LNTPRVLAVYSDSIAIIAKCRVVVAPNSDHFARLDWHLQVELARSGFKRPHVVMDLRTGSGGFTIETTPITGSIEAYIGDPTSSATERSEARGVRRGTSA